MLSHDTVVYTEFYDGEQMILTFKKESENGDVGDAVLIIMAYKYNISDILENNNVVLRSKVGTRLHHLLTFRDVADANHFCNSLRDHFNPDNHVLVTIPPKLQQIIQKTRV